MIHAGTGQPIELRKRAVELIETLERADRVHEVGVEVGRQRKLFAVVTLQAIVVRVARLVGERLGRRLGLAVVELPDEVAARVDLAR